MAALEVDMSKMSWKDFVYALIAIPIAFFSFVGGGPWFGLVVTVLLIYGPVLREIIKSL